MKTKTENLIPWDETNSENPPWLLNNRSQSLLVYNGCELSAEFIWSLKGKEREELVEWVFNHYRQNGFPFLKETPDELIKEFDKIVRVNSKEILNKEDASIITNSNSSGTNILKHFCGKEFYSSKGNSKSKSCLDVFNNDELLKKVLRNRMGYNTSKEDGKDRPYVFSMSNGMLLQGFRSSGLAYSVSTFKPAIAKFLYEEHSKNKRIFDYSSGWGARVLGAMSLKENLNRYIGIDPFTSNSVNEMIKFFGYENKANVINACSEQWEEYVSNISSEEQNTFDLAMSSPPYFNLETYGGENQSILKHNTYEEWLKNYWKQTVSNIKTYVLSPEGKFILVMVDKVGKYEIAKDMIEICKELDFNIEKVYSFQTSKSHLSGKKQSGEVVKNTERVYVLGR